MSRLPRLTRKVHETMLRRLTARIGLDHLFILAIVLWPFAFLWIYVFDLVSIGNDFSILYYKYKVYLLVSLREGHFPLWSPAEAAGFPFFSSPFTQPLYPLNILYLLYFLLLDRFSEWDYTVFTISEISIFGIGLYLWLRKLSLAAPIAFVAVLIALMSLKVTEILRIPNAVHSMAWIPWLLFGITLATDRRRLARGAIIVGLATLMLLTAGYPYYIVYALFLLVPYFVAMLFHASGRMRFLAPAPRPSNLRELFLRVGGASICGAAIAFPWLMEVRILMAQTVDRATPNFDYATQHSVDLADTVGSWIFPPASSMEGWYYFGVTTALLIAGYIINLLVPNKDLSSERRVVLMVLGWMAVIVYFTWGRNSLLFRLVWEHVPVINQMRVWGRMNIILVPAIALILALALRCFQTSLRQPGALRQPTVLPAAIAIAALAVFLAQCYMLDHAMFSYYWSNYFKSGGVPPEADLGAVGQWLRGFDERFFPLMTVISITGLGLVFLLRRRWGKFSQPIALAMVLFVSTIDLFPISSFQWLWPTYKPEKPVASIAEMLQAGFARPRLLTQGTVDPVRGSQAVGLLYNWYFIRHASVFFRYFDSDGRPRPTMPQSEIAAATRFYGADASAQRLFVTSRIDHPTIAAFIGDVEDTEKTAAPLHRLIRYDGDTLQVGVKLDQPGWLSFIDNWDPYWTATIDGRQSPIEPLFGSYKSVALSAGTHLVVFSYRPRWFRLLP